jgi:glycerol-3-phosphate dehydrogenase (NAD(P)+)
MSDWGIVGDGPWGLALARRLQAGGHRVTVAGLEKKRRGVPRGVVHTTDLKTVLTDHERLIFSVPIGEFEGLLQHAALQLRPAQRIMSTARGLTPKSHLRGTEAIARITAVRQLAVLAGAADADALSSGSPVALVVGSAFPSWSQEVQNALWSQSLRVYTNADMIGVELANVVASVVGVALGVARAMGVGSAAEATALTRALSEMNRVVSSLGGLQGTAYGLAGLGVLGEMVYDGSGHSFRAGQCLAEGRMLQADEFAEVQESARTLAARVSRHHIHAPLVTVVQAMFAGKVTAKTALNSLMERPVGAES